MNIAIVVDDYRGGAGNVAQLLALELRKTHKVSLVFTCLCSDSRYCLEGVDVYDEPMSIIGKYKIFKFFSSIYRMQKLITHIIHADLVISFLDNNNSMVCLSQTMTKIPIIVAERSNPVVIYPKFPWNIIRRIAYHRADVVSVQFDAFSEFDRKRFLHKCMVNANIVRKPNEIKTNWQSERIRFVTCGRLADIKRFDLMISLFAKVKEQIGNVELHIYGEGACERELQEMIAKQRLNDAVKLMGYHNDVHKMLLQYDIYLMTSLQEGFPNSFCEAMAVGLPTISFRCHEGIYELTQSDTCGYSIVDDNHEEYIKKMILLATDSHRRMEMGQKAQKIVERYSVENVMIQWRECIQEAIRKKQK